MFVCHAAATGSDIREGAMAAPRYARERATREAVPARETRSRYGETVTVADFV